jgi:hypothetical protein
MNADSTIKSSLLALAQTDLDAAHGAYLAADTAFRHSHSHVDRQAALEAWNKWQTVRGQYAEAYRLLAQAELGRMV